MILHHWKRNILFLILVLIGACSTKEILVVDNADKQLKMDAYEKNLKLKEIAPANELLVVKPIEVKPSAVVKTSIEKVAQPIENKKSSKKPAKHYPEIEGNDSFDGRRPLADPFVVGEKVRLKLSYFNIVAGYMDVEVLPFVQVNGRKSYHLKISGKSNDFFSSIYSVDDSGETFLDYETMIPYNMSISVKETKQLREIRSYFDWKKKKAFYWEKKITKKHGLEEKNFDWNILPYSQNIFSAIFYMRVFNLEPGKVIQFRVADNKKNMVVKGHILKRETIMTKLGEIKTIKMRPEVEIDGIFKPIGEVFFWLTDDDRKMLVRIESKIKIGTVIASLEELKR